MLEAFRKLSHHPLFKVLFGVLLLAFVLSGAGAAGTRSLRFSTLFGNNYAVKIGNERISQAAIDREYDENVRNMRRSGVDFTPEQLAAFGISKEQIKRTMIERSLIRQQVNSLGLEAGDEAVTQKIQSIPIFQTNGNFDRAKFANALGVMGQNEEQFTGMLRGDIRNELLTSTVTSNAPVNDFVAAKAASFANETRDVEIVLIPKSFKSPSSEPAEKDLQDYYFNNSYRFQIPESRDVNYIRIEKIKGKEAELDDLSNKIEDELAGGSTLKEVADKLKLKLETKPGLVNSDQHFSELFLQTAFGKDKGQISDLVQDAKNNEYFVIEVTDIKKARIPELKDVKDKVVAAWKNSNVNDQNLKYIEKMSDELSSSRDSLQSFAANNHYKYQVIKSIKRDDTEAYGARLVNAAFDAKPGEVLGSFENTDGTYKIAKLKDVHIPNLSAEDLAKFKTQMADTVRTEVMDQYLEYLRKEFPVKIGDETGKKVAASVAAPDNNDANGDVADDGSVPLPPKAPGNSSQAK